MVKCLCERAGSSSIRALFDNVDQLITYEQLSKWTALSRSTLEKYVQRNEIPAIRLNARCLRFRVGDIKDWLLSKRKGGNHDG